MTSDSATSGTVPRKTVSATLIGTIVEWYDFSIYGFLAIVLAHEFFPQGNETAALLSTYFTYVFAYAVRPIAGLILGRFADRNGRRGILAGTILLMGAATFLIGLVPGYATIGIAAPILILILRLLQGIGASGEWTIGATFLLEHSRPEYRNRRSSYIVMSFFLSMLLGSGLATLLSKTLSEAAFESWGWRILFLVSAPLALVGMYIRRSLPEPEVFTRRAEDLRAAGAAPVSQWKVIGTHWRPMLSYIGVSSSQRVAQFALSTYVVTALVRIGFEASQAFLVTFMSYLFSIPVAWLSGWWADRKGIRPVLLSAAIILAIVSVPMFLLIDTGRFWPVLLAGVLFSVGSVLGTAPMTSLLVGMFDVEVRGLVGSLGYNVATVAFGSTAPLVATWLDDRTNSNTAMGWYIAGLAVISIISTIHAANVYNKREAASAAGTPVRGEPRVGVDTQP